MPDYDVEISSSRRTVALLLTLSTLGVIGGFATLSGDDSPEAAVDATARAPAGDSAERPLGGSDTAGAGAGEGGGSAPSLSAPAGGDAGAAPNVQTAPTPATASPETGASVPAPADGVYEVAFTGATKDGQKPKGIRRTTVGTSGRTPTEVRQHHETVTQAEGRPAQTPTKADLRWTSAGAYSARPCSKNEIVLLQFPLTTGATWTTSSACEVDSPFGRMKTNEEVTVTVGASREHTALGRRMVAWEITTDTRKTTRTGDRTLERVEKKVALFSPELQFDVRYDMTVWQNGEQITTSTNELVAFKPA